MGPDARTSVPCYVPIRPAGPLARSEEAPVLRVDTATTADEAGARTVATWRAGRGELDAWIAETTRAVRTGR